MFGPNIDFTQELQSLPPSLQLSLLKDMGVKVVDKKIEQDKSRFDQIIKGKVREEFKKYISKGEMIGRQGKNIISIPLPQIETPYFRFNSKQTGGVGQGKGEPGDSLGSDGEESGQGAGDQPGQHILEVDLTLEEAAKMLGEMLELPDILPKGDKKNIHSTKVKYTGIRTVGPESLKHFKRTYKQALKRQLVSGEYNIKDPIITPIREDNRYRSWKETFEPEANAVVIYMLDVSGSMGDEQKEITRTEAFWINTWLRYQYKGLDIKYIVHDTDAYEVDEHTFYHTRESGGTKISSALSLCNKIIDIQYSPFDWNIYLFYFSDGDNFVSDNEQCISLLRDEILNKVNLFCYTQTDSYYGSGDFLKLIEQNFSREEDKLITSRVRGKEDILQSIKTLLGKGK